MKNKDVHKLLAGSITFVLVLGIISPVYAGLGPSPDIPSINMAQVQDDGNIVDLKFGHLPQSQNHQIVQSHLVME